MSLPPLYKYLDVEGARLTLRNRRFRHARPSSYKDTEDFTVRSIFPESDEEALAILKDGFTDTMLNNLDRPPTCENPRHRAMIALMQAAFRANPNAGDLVRNHVHGLPLSNFFDLERIRETNRRFVNDINEFMQGFRVLCVSKRNDSNRMWKCYAQEHEGIVLRIVANEARDSKFSLFQKVNYRAERPPVFDSALEFQEGSLFGDQEARRKAILDKIVCSKTLKWEYEEEYRLAIPVRSDEDRTTLSYHPEELSELYLGAKMVTDVRAEIVELAKTVNPTIEIFQTVLHADGSISFDDHA